MKTKTFKIAEIFLIVSLPVSLLVACNSETNATKVTTTSSQTAVTATPVTPSKTIKQDIVNDTVPKKVDLQIVKIPTKRVLNFSSNQYALSDEQQKLVKQHAQYIRYNPTSHLLISGYSDSQGPADLNYKLSKKRAEAVFEAFKKQGISSEQMEVRAYGEAFALQTVTSGYDDRRVELDYVSNPNATTAFLAQ